MKRQTTRTALGLLLGAATPIVLVAACAEDRVRTPSVNGGDNMAGAPGTPDPCSVPNDGCACDDEGAKADCGHVQEQYDDYVTCSMGTRTCTDGAWGACVSDRVTVRSTATGSPGLDTRALGSNVTCKDAGDLDPCDPYCSVAPDRPGGFDAGIPFSNTDAGLTLVAMSDGGIPCSDITLTASTNTVTVTAFGNPPATPPTTSPAGPVTFTVTKGPMGCTTASPFPMTWVVDKVDRATISGTNDTNGSLSIPVPVAGVVRVTAYGLGDSDFEDITVKVNVVEAPTTDTAAAPNDTAASGTTYTAINAFSSVANACAPTVTNNCRNSPATGVIASSAQFLYPYANTYFPLGLPAPWIQYLFTTDGDGEVKASLRYPTGLSATNAATLFNYSLIVEEQNSASEDFADATSTYLDPQVVIPQIAWKYFEQTARGNNADLVIQRRRGTSDQVENEVARAIHFVDGQLKGTVYYNSYSSPQGGNTGAILSIAPGATNPELAVQPGGKCTVCHSVSISGSHLITNTESGPGTGPNQSRRYEISDTNLFPSPTVTNSYATVTPDPVGPGSGLYQANQAGDRFTWGGAWTDPAGTLYMTHGGRQLAPTGGGDPNFRAPPDYSSLRSVNAPGTAITVNGWPNNVSAVTPRFAPDGTKLAFGYWGGNALSQTVGAMTSGTLAPLPRGSRLAVVDFKCASPPCTASTTNGYFTASNARDLTPNVSERVAWPSFTPAGTGVFYQRQYRTSRSRDAAMHQVNGGPAVTVTGAPVAPGLGRITIDTAGARGTARFDWSYGTESGTNVVTPGSGTYALGTTGLTANFPTGTYVLNADYNWDYSSSVQTGTGPFAAFSGTPVGPGVGLVTITTGGALGTSRFNWNYGGSFGTNVATAAGVALTGSGLIMLFSPGTYVVGTTYAVELGVLGSPGWSGWPGWSPSHINSTGGALAEIWMSNVPADSGTAAVPTRLLALNGLSGAGTSYLPQVSRIVSPPTTYHADNSSFTITQADNCNNTGTATAVSDYRLNYMPAANPTEAGGMVWVVFTSRRMFGNVAYDDPWDAEPWMTCTPAVNGYSDVPPTKKLWVAAVNKNFTPGTDPSYPAFYLPGQELKAGNSNGYWVNSPCADVGDSCASHDDCCLATGPSPTRECKITSASPLQRECQNISACSMLNQACVTNGDCCPNLGLTCPAGGGVCITVPSVPPTIYTVQTTSREYVANCPHGTQVKWRWFEWQGNMPANTSVDFSVQTKALAGDMYQPAIPQFLNSANSANTTNATTWYRGMDTVDKVLSQAMPGLPSRNYLKVTMTFNPASNAAPTLYGWRQFFDCVPAE